jgi:2-oxoacid:acceptor oxidoreductase gamma subunit (pyruvate/2-ketoisovalerate family)
MKQIRFHGRGGQGVVTAAEITAIAAYNEGKYAQAFPSFGVERTGAPIEAFARIDDAPIRTREHVYEPDVLIIQDASLIGTVDVTKGCRPDTLIIVNSAKPKEEIKLNSRPEYLFVIDATKIALEEIGRNIVNTVILGTVAKATGLFSLESLKKAVEDKFKEKPELVEKNIKAVTRAYQY